MLSFTKEILIKESPDKVFSYISDIAKHPEWSAFKLDIEVAPDTPVAVGSQYRTLGHMMGSKSRDEVVVTEYQPPERFVYESRSKDGHFRHIIQLQSEGDGTRLIKTWDLVQTSLGMKLWTPFIMLMAPRILNKDVNRIKQRVEAQLAPTGASTIPA